MPVRPGERSGISHRHHQIHLFRTGPPESALQTGQPSRSVLVDFFALGAQIQLMTTHYYYWLLGLLCLFFILLAVRDKA